MKIIYPILFLLLIPTILEAQQVEKVTEINYWGYNGLNPSCLTVFNDKLFFFGTNDEQYVNKLMFTDGTEAGVTEVKQIDSVVQYPTLRHMTKLNNLLIFDNKHQLWRSDGTTAGTSLLKNITTTDCKFAVLNNKVCFAGDITNSNPPKDQLCISDGTINGTKLLKTINPAGAAYIENMAECGGKIYFSAYDGEGSYSVPWVSDGTEAGTYKLKEIPCQYGANASYFTLFNGKVFFNASDDASGSQLWITDGTSNGTLEVTHINPGSIGFSPCNFIEYNSRLFLKGYNNGSYYQLWSTDGTEAGTTLVKSDYTPQTSLGFSPLSMVVNNNRLYISGYDSVSATRQLWVTDGTTTGTTKVTNFAYNFSPARLYSYQNKLVMTGYDTVTHATEIYVSDGTETGTICPKPPAGGVDAFIPWQDWVPYHGAIYYKAAYNYFADYQLCRLTLNGSGIENATCAAFRVYPNPTKESINIELPTSNPEVSIEIFNNIGVSVHQISHLKKTESVDLSNYPPGIYILKASGNNRFLGVQKIIKE